MISLAEQTEDREKIMSALAPIEVRSAIRRREKAADISAPHAEEALRLLTEEARRMVEQPITGHILAEAASIIDRRVLRSLDALQLATAIATHDMDVSYRNLIFVCSDQRLLQAAEFEGFRTLNPETS